MHIVTCLSRLSGMLPVFAVLACVSACIPSQIIEQKVILPTANPAALPSPDPEQKALIQVIHDNANALNGDDLSQYQATLHEDSDFMRLMPAIYLDLRRLQTQYNVADTKIQSQSAEIASVLVRRRTSDFTGTIEQEVLYTLRKNSSKNWKIFSMVVQTSHAVS